MKKILSLTFILLLFALTACGASSATGEAGSATPGDAAAPALSTAQTLLLGTFKLEGTEQAVTADQAANLLPLWQVYDELLTRDNAAQAEFDALTAQIQETMTADQLKAIDAMNLSQQDYLEKLQEQGRGMPRSSTASSTTTNGGNSGAQGGGPGMAPPDGGGGMPMGGDAPGTDGGNASSSSGQVASTNSGGDSMSALINGLIELLQSKVNA